MSLSRIIAACGLVIAVAVVVVQKGAISRLRLENRALRAQKEEGLRLARENEQIRDLRAGSEAIDSLRAANQELPKLRNEVRQLREQRPQIEKLRLENQRLASALKSAADKPRRLSELEGYVASETWAKAGFGSPEAAAQTWFWAIRSGDLKQIAECFSPEGKKAFEKAFEGKSDLEREKAFREGLGLLRSVKGFRIGEKKIVADDKVVVGIQVAADGEILNLPLRRFGNEWKLDETP